MNEEKLAALIRTVVREELAPVKQDIVEMKRDIVVMKQDIVEMKRDIVVMKQDIVEMKRDIVVIKQDIVEMKQDIVVMKQDIVGLKQDVVVMKQDIAELKETVSFLVDQMNLLSMRMDKLEQEMRDFRSEWADHQDWAVREFEVMKDEVSAAYTTSVKMEKEYNQGRLSERSITSIRSRISKLESQLTALRALIA